MPSVSKAKVSRIRRDSGGMVVFIPPGQPKTHWVWCTACHKHSEVPIYRLKLCTQCFKRGGGELQGVTGADERKVAAYVRGECAGDVEDGTYLG
jgi:hypothetical protein